MPRFKLTIEYEGTRYNGWQFQKEGRTIQGEFFKAIKQGFETEKFEFYGAGRTDGGVHAIGQVAHLDLQTKMSVKNLTFKLNDLLPYDINILSLQSADPKFHARYDAIARSYVYAIAKRRTAFGKPFVWWIKDLLNVEEMKKAAACFKGMKDYSFFVAQSSDDQSPKVEIQHIQVHDTPNIILIHVIGSHFLWKQVRRMVGVIVEVGRDKLTLNELNSFFKKPSEFPAQHTAPPSGLYLEHVYYHGDTISKEPTQLLNI